MRVIDNNKKSNLFFEEIVRGQAFRKDKHLFVKIDDCFEERDIEDYLENYYQIEEMSELYNYIGVINAYCLDDNFLTHIDDDEEVELVDCAIHIL